MQSVNKNHRIVTTIMVLAIVAAFFLVLWNVATIRADSKPSIFPGPIWMLRFELAHKYVGVSIFTYRVLAILVTTSLVSGMGTVIYCRKMTCVALSIACLALWLLSGVAMQQVIVLTLSLEPIKNQPDLPRVLLVGDSISIGYTLHVRNLLAGKANVHRARANCGSSERGLRLIDDWLAEGDWDLIHFNFGLHDLRKIKKNGTRILEPQVSLARYEENLTAFVERLNQTGAKLIWCATTPVSQSCGGCEPENVERYNLVAARVMSQHDIQINDLFEFASPQLGEIQPRNNIHFTYEGYGVLAAKVADTIDRELKSIERRE